MTESIDVVVLGSTGSIGTQALDVVRRHSSRFKIIGLAAGGSNLGILANQVREFSPETVAVATPKSGIEGKPEFANLRNALAEAGSKIIYGPDAAALIAGSHSTATVLNGITGGVGLASTLSALNSGATLALANKESLVVGAPLVRKAMQRPGQIIPVDSEHSAIAQALLSGTHHRGLVSKNADGKSDLHSLVLTASGGPFRGKKRSDLSGVTASQALNHPTWSMGPVVTVNSSTLMNKGLELIEASVLFDVAPDQITPVVHPQSMVHSMVTWNDGSTIAQASYPDMRVPIALGLDWPNHLEDIGVPLTWETPQSWTFEPVDSLTFPAIELAKACLLASDTHPAVLNAANETCVEAFLNNQLDWLGIIDTVAEVVAEHEGLTDPSLEEAILVQNWANQRAIELIAKRGHEL